MFCLVHHFVVFSKRECSSALMRHYGGLISPGQRASEICEEVVLSTNPLIRLFKNCISPHQQHNLMNLAKERLTEDTDTGFSASLYLRNKSDANLLVLRDLVVLAGNLSGLPWKLAEPVSLTKYSHNQNYALHFDSGFVMGSKKMKRVATFLVYLNSVSYGGETIFPRTINDSDVDHTLVPNEKPLLKEICYRDDVLKVTPEGRSCLVFYNHLTEEQGGELNPRSVHGSCPVISEEKWIAQIWLHHEPWGSGVTDFW